MRAVCWQVAITLPSCCPTNSLFTSNNAVYTEMQNSALFRVAHENRRRNGDMTESIAVLAGLLIDRR